VTDTGDSARIVANCGKVVPVRQPVALAEAILALASMDPSQRAALGLAARSRIVEDFSIEAVARHYENYYRRFVRPVR
jgi:glycosyltransferase involved in cell wall biosynthesis